MVEERDFTLPKPDENIIVFQDCLFTVARRSKVGNCPVRLVFCQPLDISVEGPLSDQSPSESQDRGK